MTLYRAYIKVENYDNDFMLYCGGVAIQEQSQSKDYTATTKVEALHNLLKNTSAADWGGRFTPHDPAPEGYAHVRSVRRTLSVMQDKARKGKLPTDLLHWGGNWDVTFVVEAVPAATRTPASTPAGTTLVNAETKALQALLAWYRGEVGDKLLHGKLWNAARALHFAKRKAKA